MGTGKPGGNLGERGKPGGGNLLGKLGGEIFTPTRLLGTIHLMYPSKNLHDQGTPGPITTTTFIITTMVTNGSREQTQTHRLVAESK